MRLPHDIPGIIEAGRLLGSAGLAPGTTGNISVRGSTCVLMTGTGARLGDLGHDDIAHLDASGSLLAGAAPTKEATLHLGVYEERPDIGAIVHLHSPAALAVSCLAALAEEDPLPVYTPYYAMRVGQVRTVRYLPPGDPSLAAEVAAGFSGTADALILRNHGMVCAAASLADAVAAAEELESNCGLHLSLDGRATSVLDAAEAEHLIRTWRRGG